MIPIEQLTAEQERRATVALIRRAARATPLTPEGFFLEGALDKLAEFIEDGKQHDKVDAS